MDEWKCFSIGQTYNVQYTKISYTHILSTIFRLNYMYFNSIATCGNCTCTIQYQANVSWQSSETWKSQLDPWSLETLSIEASAESFEFWVKWFIQASRRENKELTLGLKWQMWPQTKQKFQVVTTDLNVHTVCCLPYDLTVALYTVHVCTYSVVRPYTFLKLRL